MNVLLAGTLILFLLIFALAAVISLAGMIGWVRVDKAYKKPLFRLFIAGIAGSVISLAGVAVKTLEGAGKHASSEEMTPEFLTSIKTWNWHYAPNGWWTRGSFHNEPDGTISFYAETFFCNAKDQSEVQIFAWKSTSPVKFDSKSGTVTFAAQQQILPAVANLPDQHLLPGTLQVQMSFNVAVNVEGWWKTKVGDREIQAGIEFTH